MRTWYALITASMLCAGCTTVNLEHLTVNQSMTQTDLRYHQVMDNLARVAANPATLPSIGVVSEGTALISDTAGLDTLTLWNRALNGFAASTVTPSGKTNPDVQWTLEPAGDHEVVEALRCAFVWAINGQPSSPECMEILRDYYPGETKGYHFGVADKLHKLPAGWLHVGRLAEVPKGAIYKAHCHDTWVWVCPDDISGLSQFTLIVMDICTRDFTVLPSPATAQMSYTTITALPADKKPLNLTTTEQVTQEGKKIIVAQSPLSGAPEVKVDANASSVPGTHQRSYGAK